jgi:hypothetical protein
MTGNTSAARGWLRVAITTLLAGLGACEPTSLDESVTAPPHTLSVRVENAPVVLRASREYRNPNTWTDGEVDFTTPLGITLPASLRVTQGNAGNHKAELWYREGAGNTVHCDYRGGSDEPHPTSDYQRALGQRYVFERCSNGARPADAAHVTWLKLHVRVGDQKDATGRTEVEWRPGGTVDLEPPLSPPESVQTRDAFSWERTQPVAERNAEGHPALYYALIYLEDRDHVAALDDLLLHHDSLPLFAAELERWKGQRGFFQHEWDGKGLFRFALVPGAIYNRLREAALQDNVVFPAVVLRELPASARGQDGSISYAALRASGFLYRAEGPASTASGGTRPRTVKQELFGAILRRVVKAIADVAVGVVNEVREGIGAVDRLANGAVTLTVNLNVLNTDPAFTVGTPMPRAWGPGMGQQVLLPGVRVVARQRTLVGPLSTLFTARTGADGIARLEVARGLETSLCVALENDAAELSNFLTEIELCDFPALKADADTSLQLELQHRHFNILAQATEGRQYLRDVVDFTPHKARVLVGPLTWPFGRFTGAAVPCFGLPNLPLETAIDLVFAQVCALSGPAAPACMALYPVYPGVDIVFAETEDDWTQVSSERGMSPGLYNWVLDSRLIPTHEYGHFALCSMLFKKDPATFMSAYSGAMLSRMDADPDETNVAGYINEGFADFFASQVAGGTNYFDSPDDDMTWKYGVLNYCVSPSASCLDSNLGKSRYSSRPFDDQVARVAATLHDAFDSWQPGGGRPTANTPGNGVAWTLSPGATFPLLSNPTPPPDTKDEHIRLPGPGIYSLITRLAPLDSLSDQSIMGGLSGMASEAGFNWCERCKLFSVNDKTFALDASGNRRPFSAAELEARCAQAPIRDWLGPKPGNQQSCAVVSITGRVLQNAVPIAGVPVTLTLDGGLITRTTTDAAGAFRFDGLEPEKTYQLEATTSLRGFEYRASASARTAAGEVKNVKLGLVATVGARRATIYGVAFLANQGDTAYQTVPFNENVVLDAMNPVGHFSLLPCGGPGMKIEVDARLLPDQSIEFSGQFDLFSGCGTGTHLDSETYFVTLPPGQTNGHSHSMNLGGFRQLHIRFDNTEP